MAVVRLLTPLELSKLQQTSQSLLNTHKPPLPAKQTQQLQCISRGVSRRTTATCYRTDPVSSAEVHGLGEVVALVKPRVIGPRECHHKLASTLIGPVHLNANQKQDTKAEENKMKTTETHTSRFEATTVRNKLYEDLSPLDRKKCRAI